MAFEGWEQNPDGTIRVYPVTGWDAFVPFGMACGIRLQYAKSDLRLMSGEVEAVPLILTPPQARELAGVLRRLADKAETRASPDERGH